jgi:hypothetical protein
VIEFWLFFGVVSLLSVCGLVTFHLVDEVQPLLLRAFVKGHPGREEAL